MNLPERYLSDMKNILKDELPAYLDSFRESPVTSIRINTAKISVEEFLKISPFPLEPVPWCSSGFYVNSEDRPGLHPYYYAGLYYIQEASAMLPAEIMPVEPGDIVLDACAAPGGKSTALAAKLNGTGLLVSNDISASRQNATLKNMERAGITNSYIISHDLRDLADKLPEYFDKVLVDAPCSGEGMFRKEPSLITSWEERNGTYYAPVQKEIASSAVKMLKPGGMLVYSTCTFDPAEDEEVILYLLEQFPSLKLLPVPHHELFEKGILPGTENCVRLYPHKVKGEGHFTALLQKDGTSAKTAPATGRSFTHPELKEFMKLINGNLMPGTDVLIKDRICQLPETPFPSQGIRVIRSGLLLGTLKNNRFEPSQHLAYALRADKFRKTVILSPDDIRVEKYLRGETIRFESDMKGWVLVCAGNYPLGFGKITQNVIKNHIAKGNRKL
jgi:NOL1/NOP2/sun family putative RNA methylase